MRSRYGYIVFVFALGAVGAVASLYLSRFSAYLVASVAIASIGAVALNVLVGLCGQISFSQGALLGVGAYTAGNLSNADHGGVGLLLGACFGALVGVLFGLPSLRLRGLYFGISTIATQFLFEYFTKIADPITNGVSGLIIKPLRFVGIDFSSDARFAAMTVAILALVYVVLEEVRRTDLGRAFLVIRENEVVARGMGINVTRVKLWAFAISGFFAGVAGGLLGLSTRLASPETFNLSLSIDYVAMIIVGGLGSLPGSILGAAFVMILPEAIERIGEVFNISDILSAVRELVFGVLMVFFLIYEPRGLAGLSLTRAFRTKRRRIEIADPHLEARTVSREEMP